MALVRWAPTRDLSPVQTEMTRLFGTLFDTATPLAPSPAASRRFVPAMDIEETEQEFLLRVDLPGMTDEDVKLEVLDGVLTISGERRREQDSTNGGYRRIERIYGGFSRSLTLPKGLDASAISASFEHGVLEIHVPKPEEARPQAVQIKIGSDSVTDESVATEPSTSEPVTISA